jgi:CRISPR-associated endonuclease/helicase Cas3
VESALLSYLMTTIYINRYTEKRKVDDPLINSLKYIISNAILEHHSKNFELSIRSENIKEYKTNLKYLERESVFKLFLTYLKEIEILDKLPEVFLNVKVMDTFKLLLERIEQIDFSNSKIRNLLNEMQFDPRKYSSETNIVLFFLFKYYSSILIDLDEWDASNRGKSKEFIGDFDFERSSYDEDIIKNYIQKNSKPSSLNSARNKLLSNVERKLENAKLNQIYLLTAPTGAGKTFTLLRFALGLKHKYFKQWNFKPKIIYTLPFVSICDQVENILKEIINKKSQTKDLTVHHYLSDFEIESEDSNEENFYLKPFEISLWRSNFVITTTIKFFDTIFHFDKNNVKRFHRLVNSIVIIDEYHSLPIKYHEIIKKTLVNLSKYFNITFILATATTPAIFTDKNSTELAKQDFFSSFNRYKITACGFDKPYTFEEFCEYSLKVTKNNSKKNILIIVNTKRFAKELYEYLDNKLSENAIKTSDDIFHLSTNMVPIHRKEVIFKKIIPKLEDNEKGILLVTTQLIEAGIDVSFDLIIREFAPFSSIIQGAGRCNRHAEDKSEKLPEVLVLKVQNKYNPYDQVDLDITENFIENLKKKLGSSSDKEFTEKFIRNNYILYSQELNNYKRSSELYEEFSNLEFLKFHKDFKLIKEKKEYPLVVVFDDDRFEASTKIDLIIKEIENWTNFPRKLWNYTTNISQSSQEKLFGKIKEIKKENIHFFILNLKNPESKKYYDQKIGLSIG